MKRSQLIELLMLRRPDEDPDIYLDGNGEGGIIFKEAGDIPGEVLERGYYLPEHYLNVYELVDHEGQFQALILQID